MYTGVGVFLGATVDPVITDLITALADIGVGWVIALAALVGAASFLYRRFRK